MALFGFNTRPDEMLMTWFTCPWKLTHRKLRCVGNFNSYIPIG